MPQGTIARVFDNTDKTGGAWRKVMLDGDSSEYGCWKKYNAGGYDLLAPGNRISFDSKTGSGGFIFMSKVKLLLPDSGNTNTSSQPTTNISRQAGTNTSIELQSTEDHVVNLINNLGAVTTIVEAFSYVARGTQYLYEQKQRIKNGDKPLDYDEFLNANTSKEPEEFGEPDNVEG